LSDRPQLNPSSKGCQRQHLTGQARSNKKGDKKEEGEKVRRAEGEKGLNINPNYLNDPNDLNEPNKSNQFNQSNRLNEHHHLTNRPFDHLTKSDDLTNRPFNKTLEAISTILTIPTT